MRILLAEDDKRIAPDVSRSQLAPDLPPPGTVHEHIIAGQMSG